MTPPTSKRSPLVEIGAAMLYKNDTDRFPVRKHPRLKDFDYKSYNYYFITLCTYDKACLFGSPLMLSDMGEIAKNCLMKIPEHFPGVTVDKYVVMPNHIHGIVVLPGNTVELSTVVGQYKAAVTKMIHKFCPSIRVWQTSFHDHIIRNQTDYERIWSYIETNPARWIDDCFYTPQAGQ